MKIGLHLYFGRIKVHGLDKVPLDKAVLFLPNHQSALLDVLLIAVDCNRKPFFLTRSDVFQGKLLKAVFNYFQMIPIYRIRDGRESLQNNQAIFEKCAQLLGRKEALLMFPEANHNLRRRVRPLSKGFTRILFNALDSEEDLDIHLVPIGINYQDSTSFPGKAALYFGKSIPTRKLYRPNDLRSSVSDIKSEVSTALKSLTTHIADETRYEEIAATLEALQVDYLDPIAVNDRLADRKLDEHPEPKKVDRPWAGTLLKTLFLLVNLPMVLIWKKIIKPKVWEPEFTGTLRFAFALLGYPIYYGLLLLVLGMVWGLSWALLATTGIFLFNWGYVRFAQ